MGFRTATADARPFGGVPRGKVTGEAHASINVDVDGMAKVRRTQGRGVKAQTTALAGSRIRLHRGQKAGSWMWLLPLMGWGAIDARRQQGHSIGTASSRRSTRQGVVEGAAETAQT